MSTEQIESLLVMRGLGVVFYLDTFDPKPDETITVSVKEPLDREASMKTVGFFSSMFPGHQIVILHSGATIG